jgi:hypothetical protein
MSAKALFSPLSSTGVVPAEKAISERKSPLIEKCTKSMTVLNFPSTCPQVTTCVADDIVPMLPVLARKRGKCMTRRAGQNPMVRVGKRSNGEEYFYFQYWVDVPGREERQRQTEVIGSTSQMTKSEAVRKKIDFIMSLGFNSNEYRIPSSRTFADAERTTGKCSHPEC